MRHAIATLCTLVALTVIPASSDAVLGRGYCRVKKPATVEVQKGNNLIGIAKQEYGDWRKYKDIAKHNNIKYPYLIFKGQVLQLPGKITTTIRPRSAIDDSISCPNYI